MKPFIIEVFGDKACERDSAFYTGTERYERGLFWWVGHGDPAIGTALPMTKDQFSVAFTAKRQAETALVSCSVMNGSRIAVKVKVSPDSGMVPIDGQTEAVLDPGATHAFFLKPAPGIAGPIGELPQCSFDRSIPDKERDKPYPRWEIAVALGGALLAALTALYGALKGKPS